MRVALKEQESSLAQERQLAVKKAQMEMQSAVETALAERDELLSLYSKVCRWIGHLNTQCLNSLVYPLCFILVEASSYFLLDFKNICLLILYPSSNSSSAIFNQYFTVLTVLTIHRFDTSGE